MLLSIKKSESLQAWLLQVHGVLGVNVEGCSPSSPQFLMKALFLHPSEWLLETLPCSPAWPSLSSSYPQPSSGPSLTPKPLQDRRAAIWLPQGLLSHLRVKVRTFLSFGSSWLLHLASGPLFSSQSYSKAMTPSWKQHRAENKGPKHLCQEGHCTTPVPCSGWREPSFREEGMHSPLILVVVEGWGGGDGCLSASHSKGHFGFVSQMTLASP